MTKLNKHKPNEIISYIDFLIFYHLVFEVFEFWIFSINIMSRIFEITAKDETAKAFEKWEEPAGEGLDLIEETRRAVAQLSERERFERAKIHLEHALKYKNPRIDIFSQS